MRLVIGLLGLAALCAPAHAESEAMKGVWQRGDGQAHVRINRCGAAMCAVNTWVKNPDGGEKVGDRLVMSVNPKAPSVLAGTAFDPQRNLTYRIEIKLAEQRMTTKGCVLGGVLCRNVGWMRMD